MQKYLNSIATSSGKPVSGASVTVLTYPAGVVASIYSDNVGTPQSNPTTTDSDGNFSFYAADGRYSLQITGSGSRTITINDVLLEDPTDGGSPGSFSSITVGGVSLGGSAGSSVVGDTNGGGLWTTVAGFIAKIVSSAGSSVIGFIQSGTGAVARWVQDKLRETVSVKDFGAKCDGVTDDSAAITAAITYANSNSANLILQGSIYCASGLTAPSGTYNLEGRRATITFAAGVTNGVTVGTVGATPYSGRIRGLNIQKASYSGSDVGFLLLNCTNCTFEDNTATNFAQSTAAMPNSSSRVAYNTFINHAANGHQYGFYAAPAAGCYVNENTFLAGRFNSTAALRLVDQIHLDNTSGTGCDHNRFLGVSIEGYSGGGACGNSAATLVGACLGNVFNYCRGEAYGTGWSSGYTYNFDATCLRNRVIDSDIGITVNDASGFNVVDLPTTGYIGSDASGGVAHPVFKYTRQVANTDNVKKFAINITDTYSSSGKVGFLYYSSPIGESRAGKLVSLNTAYGEVHAMDDAGTILPRDNFANLGGLSNRWQYIYTFYFRQTPVAVASLPAPGTITAGGRAFVSDATATTFGTIVAGSGTNNVPVYSDGTNWRIG